MFEILQWGRLGLITRVAGGLVAGLLTAAASQGAPSPGEACGTLKFFSDANAAQSVLELHSPSFTDNSHVPFRSHGGAGTLSMNIQYDPIRALRAPIERTVGRKLLFLMSFEPGGEAHVTTVTPPEFGILGKKLSMKEIEAIAVESGIQGSDLKVLGIGSGKVRMGGQNEETFFVVVRSERLVAIRKKIQEAYVAQGGAASDFDPEHFYSHITIGFTKRDLHEQDGVIKDSSSLDPRFKLVIDDAKKL